MKYFDGNTWFWILLSALAFIPFLGGVHLFDWDEINFAELAREMTVTGDYLRLQINYESFTEKPPLFFWLQAISMNIFGVGEFAARFPNALLGVIVLPFLYISGKFLIDRKFGFLWALSWFGSILPFMYFKSGIIDPLFNFFIFNGLFFLIHYIWRKNSYRDLYFSKSAGTYLWLAGISVGLGVLTKGPVAYLLVFLTLVLYWVFNRFRKTLSFGAFLKFSFIALGVFLLWFGVDLAINGPDFIVEFTIRQWELLTTSDAGHKGFMGYHLVVLLLGCFPASIFALRGLGRFSHLSYHIRDFQKWMITLLLVILVLFSLVGTKIVHYSSMAYYPISFLSALTIWSVVERRTYLRNWISIFSFLVACIILAASIVLPLAGQHPEEIKGLLQSDPFAVANLNAEVSWPWYTYIPAGIVFLSMILFFGQSRRRPGAAVRYLFFGMAAWCLAALYCFVGRIEKYSQNAAVKFFEQQQNEEVYVTSFGYKSYVPWFYARVMPYGNPKAADDRWLLFGDTDRPVMISTKLTSRQKINEQIPDAEFQYEENGFLFYRRD